MAAARFDKAVEINCRPERLDPPEALLQLAVEGGCKVSIDSDAHAGPARVAALRLCPGGRRRRPGRTDREHVAGGRLAGVDGLTRREGGRGQRSRGAACRNRIARPGRIPYKRWYDDDGDGPHDEPGGRGPVEGARRYGVPPTRGERRRRPHARRCCGRRRCVARRPAARLRAAARRHPAEVCGHVAPRAAARQRVARR